MQQVANPVRFTPGPRQRLRRLHRLVSTYYQVHAHLPGSAVPLTMQNLLAVILLPCGAPHPDAASCPDCVRLLAHTLDAIRAEPACAIWPAIAEAVGTIEAAQAGALPQEVPAESPIRRAGALLPELADYHATLHSPCVVCGSLLWYEIPARRFRCLICAPPAHFPVSLRASILETCTI